MKKLLLCLGLLWATDAALANDRLAGYLIASPENITAVTGGNKNGFAIAPKSIAEAEEILQRTPAGVKPILEIGYILEEDFAPLLKYDFIMMVDEPFWNTRLKCYAGDTHACIDIWSRYSRLQYIYADLRARTGKELLHIESWAELMLHGTPVILEATDYVGFNCYGRIDHCGNEKYGYHSQYLYAEKLLSVMDLSRQKLFLVAGTFFHENFFESIKEVEQQLKDYIAIFKQYPELIKGIGFFLWDTVPGDNPGETYIGAEDLAGVRKIVDECL